MRILKKFRFLLMTMTLVIVSISCKSDDDGGDGGNAPTVTIPAKIGGTTFTSLELTSIATLAARNLIIQGNDAIGKSIVKTIFGYNGEGTYMFTGVNPAVLNIANYIESDMNNPVNTQSWTSPFDNTVGSSVSIATETDNSVEVTFEFTGKNAGDMSTTAITEGSFNLTEQTQ